MDNLKTFRDSSASNAYGFMKEFCNPVNLEYKFQHYGQAAHREAADPTLIYFKEKYYMFVSMSAGFYHSDDLISWQWHENRQLELYKYAPDVRACGDYLYFCASDRKPTSIWRTKNPFSNDFEKVSTPFAFWDPNMFFDDDGRVYFFWGCGNVDPLYGIELDSTSFMPVGQKVPVIFADKENHGFERYNYPGKEPAQQRGGPLMRAVMRFMNRKGMPYMEGAYCNKWNGKYYLQYAAPATEVPTYANGVYISDKPLGPYSYQPHNPFSSKPSGFINGAGHGSTIEDEYGNLWHAASMRISVNASFERRIGLFPAGLDEDGLLYCNQSFADYPCAFPEGKSDPRELKPQFMLLSYKKNATSSSSLEGHGAELALNEDVRTWWSAEGSSGEWYRLDLGREYPVHSIQLNLAEESIPVMKMPKTLRSGKIWTNDRYIDSGNDLHSRYLLKGSIDEKNWFVIKDATSQELDRSHDYIILEPDTKIRYIRVTAFELPYGQKFAISGLRVFGLGNGSKPEAVRRSSVSRPDSMTAAISWEKVPNAIGYNIRYGIAPDKLYSSSLVYEKNEAVLTMLNQGTEYWYCIDSFNESGITEGKLLPLESE